MSDYEQQLEKQNEELQQKLAELQHKFSKMHHHMFIVMEAWGVDKKTIEYRNSSIVYSKENLKKYLEILSKRSIASSEDYRFLGYVIQTPHNVMIKDKLSTLSVDIYPISSNMQYIEGWEFDASSNAWVFKDTGNSQIFNAELLSYIGVL